MSDWSEAAFREFVAGLEAERARHRKELSLAEWELNIAAGPENARRMATAQAEFLKFAANPGVFARLKGFRDHGQVQDPVPARQLERIYRSFLSNQLTADEIEERVRRETEINELFATFRAEVDGQKLSENDIKQVLQDETDNTRRQAAWEASKQIGARAAPGVRELARMRNRIAARLGFRDFYAMQLWLQEIDEEELFGVLGELRRLTDAPFARMKAALDARLARQFGVAPGDLMPWHYADPFFQELPRDGDLDLDPFFRGKDTVALARDYFASLGLDVADILARSDLYEREGKNQHAFCLDVDRMGDVRVLCNMRDNEHWMAVLLHELGHAVYDKHLDPALPLALRAPAHTLTTEAIAMLFGRLTKEACWLQAWAGVPAARAQEVEAAAGDQLTRSMLVFVRWGLVMAHFERGMYLDPEQDLDSLWWRLVSDLQGLRTPPGRPAPDWAAKIHVSAYPVYYHNYILGELTASQFGAALRRDTGGGLTANPAAGPWLVERVFRRGAHRPWNELIRQATGEPLDPRHFVDQFVSMKK